ncbi:MULTISPECIES: hypothetical protein [Cellulomonas]|uniref:Uncharacterized protein n=1 Tax=Cellulomonas gilvus (strain ATCC 13127 / NRRL B-14078) TaxID=593907 RepID=F8A2R8_CELGA|nr:MULTISPECIES: hypothetical protein [Cellulomonas]AEI10635.1 hypothetical protein Celgi_0103 [Cellulomonas gilvus ATCC 13127]MCR6688445.1 hypothetical protein [Cellulomonas sp.]
MTWVLMIGTMVAPALVFGFVWSLFPGEDDAPRWRAALAHRLETWADRLRRHEDPPYDPFTTLRVQERLGKVADHVRSLELDAHCYARAEKIIASQRAYDQLLVEACLLAGVEVEHWAPGDPAERFRQEVELAARGWSW